MNRRVAAIDCGTNSVRLLIAEIDPTTGLTSDVTRQMRIRLEQLGHGHALAELLQDQLDGDAGALDGRLAHHDLGIGDDPLVSNLAHDHPPACRNGEAYPAALPTSSVVSPRYASSSSSADMPLPSFSRIRSTGIRVPLMQGLPPMTPRSIEMRWPRPAFLHSPNRPAS